MMTEPETVTAPHIPIWYSRHTPRERLGEDYGAFIDWRIGERVRIISKRAGIRTYGTVQSEVMAHPDAYEINGAHGRGRWVREVLVDGEDSAVALSCSILYFEDTP